jgi:hypothetical protein
MELIYQNYPPPLLKEKKKDNTSCEPYRMNTILKYILEGDRQFILDSFFIFTKSTVTSTIASKNFTYSTGFIKVLDFSIQVLTSVSFSSKFELQL